MGKIFTFATCTLLGAHEVIFKMQFYFLSKASSEILNLVLPIRGTGGMGYAQTGPPPSGVPKRASQSQPRALRMWARQQIWGI